MSRNNPLDQYKLRRKPVQTRRPLNRSELPTKPGRYYWSEWKAVVDVYTKGPRCRALFVVPPVRGGIEVRISPFIAGTFTPVAAQVNVVRHAEAVAA